MWIKLLRANKWFYKTTESTESHKWEGLLYVWPKIRVALYVRRKIPHLLSLHPISSKIVLISKEKLPNFFSNAKWINTVILLIYLKLFLNVPQGSKSWSSSRSPVEDWPVFSPADKTKKLQLKVSWIRLWSDQRRYSEIFKEPRNRFQGIAGYTGWLARTTTRFLPSLTILWTYKLRNALIFLNFFFYVRYGIQHCFICRPSDSTMSEDAGIEPKSVATSALAVRTANHYRSHPRTYNIAETQILYV